MVLKISSGNGWKFLGGVKEVQCTRIEGILPDAIYDDMFLYYHSLKDGKFVRSQSISPETVVNTLEMLAIFNDGQVKTYVADLAVYLMSDEGKTIERVN